jgi:hypothetical protein
MSIDKQTGSVQWTQTFGTSAWDELFDIQIDRINGRGLYTTGCTGGVLGVSNAGRFDVFVGRHLLNNGSLISALQFGSAGSQDTGYALKLNQFGTHTAMLLI